MKFIRYNANPSKRNIEDCAVRVISKATNQSWTETLQGLTELALVMHMMPNNIQVTTKYLRLRGWTWHKGDGRKMKDYHFKSTHVVRLSGRRPGKKHLTYCDDGAIYDTWNCENCRVDGYFNPPKK